MFGRPTLRFVRCREANLVVREAHPEVREGSGGPPGRPGGVGLPTRRSRRVRKADPKVREAH